MNIIDEAMELAKGEVVNRAGLMMIGPTELRAAIEHAVRLAMMQFSRSMLDAQDAECRPRMSVATAMEIIVDVQNKLGVK